MNSHDGSPEREELKRLLERLEAMSIRHHAELDSIRSQILALESRISAAPQPVVEEKRTSTPPPLPSSLHKAESEDRKFPALKEAKLNLVPAEEEKEDPKPKAVEIPELIEKAITPPEQQRDESLELDIAKNWFGRIGIVILLMGLVFAGNYAYQNWIKDMSNGVRLTALFFCAGLLFETGRQLAKRENLNRLGEVVLAGGMAFFYYCTFAAHHVARLKVIDSAVLGAGLLFLSAGLITAISWARQARFTAAFCLVLASYATMLQPIGWMSCASNLVLALAGLFFMTRRGWSGPGWVSMLGAYAGFFGSQILAYLEYGEPADPLAMLWFLPPLWLMFVMPGLLGRYRENLTERSRAWMAGINNGLFFLLFTILWINEYGSVDYWKVSAVFSIALLLIGILGRLQDTISGGVNISQGLAVGTLALVLKFDGHQLGLVLAVESLSLAIAAWRFRGRSEVVFSVLAALICVVLVIANGDSLSTMPVWSLSLSSALLAAGSVVLIRAKERVLNFGLFLNIAAALVLVSGAFIANCLCHYRLEHPQGMIVSAVIATALTAAYLKIDRKYHQPITAWVSLWFLIGSIWISLNVESLGALIAVMTLLFPACWLWHRQTADSAHSGSADFRYQPAVPAWLFSLAIPIFIWQIVSVWRGDSASVYLVIECAALVLAGAAILLRCHRLVICSSMLALFALNLLVSGLDIKTPHIFTSALIAFGAAVTAGGPWSRNHISKIAGQVSAILFRLTGFLAFMFGFYKWSPEFWGDWIALSGGVIVVISAVLKRKSPEEALGWILIAMLWLIYHSTNESWDLLKDAQTWRGGLTVLSLVMLLIVSKLRPSSIIKFDNPKQMAEAITCLMCVLMAMWATQMLVWRFDWKPAAVLWTILGFAFVSIGLWQRLHVARAFGFALLAMSLIKLFVSDVWDFTAFMRVVSFIALGAALILLGLFYNKFAPAIKALLDSEK